ncbi:MAG: tripartite tricarboxylate transporter substrate binding protein [Rhizobiaceae bacterium]|nr:tripartite tricarboxylate transporter substrate binding protein [Rhizobiaceae bacterium]
MTLSTKFTRREFAKIAGISALTSLAGVRAGLAASYPSKAIALLVGYAPGGVTDLAARLLADRLGQSLGETVVENKPGATGSIAAQYVAKSNPDGHTLLLGNNPEISINQFLSADTGFNPETDLLPIAPVYTTTHAVVVPANSPYSSLMELVDAAKASPGKIRFGSTGNGTPSHLAGQALAIKVGVDMVHIPYKGGGPALTAVMGGHIECCVSSLPSAKPHIDSGVIRIVAVTSTERIQRVADVPTVKEVLGIDAFDFPLFAGVFGPAALPVDLAQLIHTKVADALNAPELKAKFEEQNIGLMNLDMAAFAQYIKEQTAVSKAVLSEIGLAK